MALSFIGVASADGSNGNNANINLASASPSAPTSGDIVVIVSGVFGRAGNEGRIGNALSYTEILDQTNTQRLRVAYKIFVTGETSVAVEGTGNASDSLAAVAMIFRGQDVSSPFDVTATTATGSSTNPNAPAITPTNNNCMILAVAASSSSDGTVTAPTNYTNSHRSNSNTNSASTSMARRLLSGGGGASEDPAAWAAWTTGAWVTATLAIRESGAGAAKSVAAGSGSFALTGTAAVVNVSHAVAAGAGSYALTGTAATLRRNVPVAAGAGSYVLTGTAASFAFTHVMSAGAGSFLLTGSDATLSIRTDKFLAAGAGSYSLNGTSASVLYGRKVAAGAGSYALTGTAATVHKGVVLAAGAGSFALAGTAAAIKHARKLAAAAGSFVLTGAAASIGTGASLTLAPVTHYIFLVEIEGHDGVSVLHKYLSTAPFTDVITNQEYDPRVIDPGSFHRDLGLDSNPVAESTAVRVASGDPGTGETLDDWLDLGFGNRPIVIKALPRGSDRVAGNAITILNSTISAITSDSPLSYLDIGITDRLGLLGLPLLSDLYAGTTLGSAATIEGNADLEGQIKQRLFGSVSTVPVQPANPYDLIYLVSNSALQSIALSDGGLALTNSGDYASVALLRAATIAPGAYATCLTLGLVRVGATPAKDLTADVVEGANAAARTAAQIAYRMLIAFGVGTGEINAATFTALDVKNDAVCGYFIDDDRTALDAINEVLAGIGSRLVQNRAGLYEVFRIEAPVTASDDLTFDVERQDIGDTLELVDINVPVWRVVVQYAQVHHVMEGDALLGAVTPEARATFGAEYRTVFSEDASVLTKHLDARELTVTTNIALAADAQDEADRLLALLSQQLKQYKVKISQADAFAAELGTSVGLLHDRLGMDSVLDAFVVARNELIADEKIELTVRG